MKRKTPKALSDNLISALAGKAPESAATDIAPPVAEPVDPTPNTQADSEPQQPKTPEPAPPAPKAEDSSLVTHLKEELQASRTENSKNVAEVAKLQMQLESANSQLTTVTTLAESCYAAIRQMTERLSIGLGSRVAGLENLTGDNLLAQWNKVKGEFDARYVSGGKASSEARETADSGAENSAKSRRAVKATALR